MKYNIDKNRILNELITLKQFNDRPDLPGTTRPLFSKEEMKAKDYVKNLMTEIGMEISEDGIGNIYGTLKGDIPELAPVWSGSHIDTVISAGMYDGMTGVISAIEACRQIKENDFSHKRNIQVIIFASEEPTRFGTGCIGSRAMAGHLSLEETKGLIDDDGITLYDELLRLGFLNKDYDKTVVKHKGDVFASVELHIEQAPVLERSGITIGVVQGICAPSYIDISIEGQQKHAGSTPMCDRKDAVTASAEIITEVESIARSYGNTHTVATVGKVQVSPNAPNVIAGKVRFHVDIRDIDENVKKEITSKICKEADAVADIRNVKVEYNVTTDDLPRKCNEKIQDLIEKKCNDSGVTSMRMISGAYHDSLLVAEFAPIGMIFVPSKDGISHDPAEYTDIDDIVKGTDILTSTLLDLSNSDSL